MAAADSPGYPTTVGTPALREAVVAWFERRRGVGGLSPDAVLPTIGSKELVAWLPTLLGVGAGDLIRIPCRRVSDLRRRGPVGGGATPIVVDGLAALGP